MKYDIGDKVRVVSYPNPERVGQIAIVHTIYPKGCTYQYLITMGEDWASSVHEREIEPVLKIGQQLLFEFMV